MLLDERIVFDLHKEDWFWKLSNENLTHGQLHPRQQLKSAFDKKMDAYFNLHAGLSIQLEKTAGW
jgi:hypothetical protein